ncbi:serine hydrolase [Actinocorallia sp. A-T 12471]|uniref:serine hydrolase n=1 Tax=Actinocorallia sp. A-T 12471 TaxID=3089813 RepID=UPI0029D239DD|nr:serine hydrolase [Actinocorallia sp. A-T 12471]MDX6742995.1 serine hydrolase [Actinocorallia sp. A-T 12471]
MTAAIEAEFREAGVRGWLHALDLDSGAQLGVGAEEPVVLASVFKVPLLVAFFRRAAAGALDPREQVTLPPASRIAGPTGTSVLLDDVRMSLRDLACLMITVSDNTAAEAVLDRVGLPAVNRALAELGLTRTRVVAGARELHASMLADAGVADAADLWARIGEPGMTARLSALDPARATRGTPRDMTALLAAIWRDEAAPPESCALMRRMLGLQVWPHRLASGFPYDDVLVSGKTGTLPTLRNEIGVVEYPDGGRYAVAVFTRSRSTAATLPRADAVIGTTARLAIHSLRTHTG